MYASQLNPPFDFQKLEVYKKAKEFHLACKVILKSIPLERYTKDQLARASYSVVLNIAEGSGRITPADRRNFFATARASVFECVAILDLLFDEDLIKPDIHHEQNQRAGELSKMLFAMIRNLGESQRKQSSI